MSLFQCEGCFQLKQVTGEALNIDAMLEDLFEAVADNRLYRLDGNRIIFEVRGEITYSCFMMDADFQSKKQTATSSNCLVM